MMRRMESLPSSVVVVWPSVASACCGLKALSGVSVECPPRYTEIGWDGDWERGGLSDMYTKGRFNGGHTCTDLMLLDMLICTEIFTFLAVTALLAPPSLSPLGRAPYLGALLVGIVNLRPSTSASCFNTRHTPGAGGEDISGVLFQ